MNFLLDQGATNVTESDVSKGICTHVCVFMLYSFLTVLWNKDIILHHNMYITMISLLSIISL